MRFGSTVLFSAIVLTSSLPLYASTHTRRGPTSPHFSSKRSTPVRKPVAQQSIDGDRATQIQTALIAQGYLNGSPTGSWTPETQEALRKLQSDNGWQTKMVPDARAIIKLGLGPGLPAPESAMAGTAVRSAASAPDTESSIPSQR